MEGFLVFALLPLGVCTAPESEFPPAWRFVEEEIRVDVSASDFTVRGDYHFRGNPGADALAIQYPFPADTSLGEPECLDAYVQVGPSRKSLQVLEDHRCWRWVIEPPGVECAVHIVYRQRMNGNHARYVLISARQWGRPIERAVIEVSVPSDGRYEITPGLTAVMSDATRRTYRGDFKSFFPQQDQLIQRTAK